MSLCQIVPIWTGPRRSNPFGVPLTYREQFLRAHKLASTSLDLLVFVVNICYESDKFIEHELRDLEDKYKPSFGVDIIFRPNKGMSYGALLDGYEKHAEFDKYIFIEDDYVPILADYDKILEDLFDERIGEDGFLCGLTSYSLGYARHASVFLGIMDNKGLASVILKADKDNLNQGASYSYAEFYGQFLLSTHFYRLEDYSDIYETNFYFPLGDRNNKTPKKSPKEEIFVPIQLIDELELLRVKEVYNANI